MEVLHGKRRLQKRTGKKKLPPQKKKKSKGKVIALVAVLLAVALVVAGVLFIVDMNRDRTGNEKEDKTVTITLSDSETFDTQLRKLVDAGVVGINSF